MQIGMIGFGRFGRFAAEILKYDFEVYVCDRKKVPRRKGVTVTSFEEVARKPFLLLCVAISEIQSVCRKLRPLLKKGQLVLDTCSVKERPLAIMTQLLPRSVEILGTHPLFGPDSARPGIKGLRIVLCQSRCKNIGKVEKYLGQLGLKVILTTAERHDREMANSQALFHFLARGVAAMRIKLGPLSTPGPSRLFNEFKDVQNDSRQLFQDLHKMNRFARGVRKKLIENLTRIDAGLLQEY